MDPIVIPQPPTDPAFYQWLSGVGLFAFLSIVGYAAHRFISASDKNTELLQIMVTKVTVHETEIETLKDDVGSLKNHVFPVRHEGRYSHDR